MKVFYTLLLAIMLSSIATIAQADDYLGTYSCSGKPVKGGAAGLVYPPEQIIIRSEDNSYRIIVQYPNVETIRVLTSIEANRAYWSLTRKLEQNFELKDALNLLTFNGSKIHFNEQGLAKGRLTSTWVTLKAVCTK